MDYQGLLRLTDIYLPHVLRGVHHLFSKTKFEIHPQTQPYVLQMVHCKITVALIRWQLVSSVPTHKTMMATYNRHYRCFCDHLS